MNIYVDGWVELQRKRSGDLLQCVKGNDNVWYWFSYVRGMLMSYSSNQTYNDLLSKYKGKRCGETPKQQARVDFVYMLGLRDRLLNFLRRMESGGKGFRGLLLKVSVIRSFCPGSTEFNYLHITDFVAINCEAKHGHDFVHAGETRSARVDAQHVMAPVMDDFDDMRVAAYKYVRLQFLYQLQRTRRITAG